MNISLSAKYTGKTKDYTKGIEESERGIFGIERRIVTTTIIINAI